MNILSVIVIAGSCCLAVTVCVFSVWTVLGEWDEAFVEGGNPGEI